MTRILAIAAAAASTIAFAPAAQAAETITVPFDTPSTGTTGLYSGTVRVRVSGTGFSNGSNLNDAFYNVPSGTVEPSGYYQLGFSTSPLVPFDSSKAAFASVVGGRPAYQASHVYDFFLNTGSATPTQLFFGVTDGQFGDNGGEYTIAIGVPEPATWALMILGFGAIGGAMRRRQTVRATVRFA